MCNIGVDEPSDGGAPSGTVVAPLRGGARSRELVLLTARCFRRAGAPSEARARYGTRNRAADTVAG